MWNENGADAVLEFRVIQCGFPLCPGIQRNERISERDAQNMGFVTYKLKDFQLTKKWCLERYDCTLRSEPL